MVKPDGPIPAGIMLCGEAPGAEEEQAGIPFVGASGQELNRMLHEAGIMRSECFVTNLCRVRPPGNDIGAFIATRKKDITKDHVPLRDKMVLPVIVKGYEMLQQEIALVNPNIIVAFGNSALWALTGKWGIVKHRGSMLRHSSGAKVIPTFHPAAILRQWDWRAVALNDLRRVKAHCGNRDYDEPQWRFVLQPTFGVVMQTLEVLLQRLATEKLWIDFDIETKFGHIDCVGLSWSLTEAICIPFLSQANKEGYWPEGEEAYIINRIYAVLTHKNALIRGQNLLYDAQYTYRHWHFVPRVAQDTMISWHVAFPGLPKKLDFQASLLCKHFTQWKPDRSAWKDGG
jgi:uracil-DNA glycosylase